MALHDDLNGAIRLVLMHYRVRQADAAVILGMSRMQFTRRLQDVTPWTIQDLETVVARFGIPPELLFAGGLAWIDHLSKARAHPFNGRVQMSIT